MFTNYHDEPRLGWLCEKLMLHPRGDLMLHWLGFAEDEFERIPSGISPLEAFRDAIDQKITEENK
jgi:hypothetical protein